MFRCKMKNGERIYVTWEWVKNRGTAAWLPAITRCNQYYSKLSRNPNPEPEEDIPNVTGLTLTEVEDGVSITWTPNELYLTEIQIKRDGGEWETLDLVEAGIGEV